MAMPLTWSKVVDVDIDAILSTTHLVFVASTWLVALVVRNLVRQVVHFLVTVALSSVFKTKVLVRDTIDIAAMLRALSNSQVHINENIGLQSTA